MFSFVWICCSEIVLLLLVCPLGVVFDLWFALASDVLICSRRFDVGAFGCVLTCGDCGLFCCGILGLLLVLVLCCGLVLVT